MSRDLGLDWDCRDCGGSGLGPQGLELNLGLGLEFCGGHLGLGWSLDLD